MNYMIRDLYALERLSGGESCIHRLHPIAKLSATAAFIVTVASFDRYSFGRLIPYVFYPALMTALSETPYALLFKRFLVTLPFCLFAGITNVVFDTAAAFSIGGAAISGGVLSLFTLLFKAYLCVMAAMLLVSATSLPEITGAMRRMKIPGVFVAVFEMTYRYIGALLAEAYSMRTAYILRSGGGKGVAMKDMGGFAGQLLIRGADRADRVYVAMKCRGYAPDAAAPRLRKKFRPKDAAFCAAVFLLCAALRAVDVIALIGGRARC